MLAVLVPVLGRPHRVKPLLEAFAAAMQDPYRVLFICDPGDVATQDAIALEGGLMISPGGSYAQKINRGVRETDEPYVAMVADDVVPQKGWFSAAMRAVDAGAQVVGLNDLRKRSEQANATHFLATRAYCNLPTIDGGPGPLHEQYAHNFPDRELVETAKKRRVYTYCADAVIEHHHHLDGRAEWDDTYAKGQATFRIDQRRFRYRSGLWA